MIQGVFFRRKSRRLAEIEVDGQIFEAYISNGIDMSFLKSGIACYLREAENPNRRTPFDLYSVYDHDTLVCVDAKEPLRIAEKWCSEKYNNEGDQISFYSDARGMTLLAMNRKNHDLLIQVMGTSFVDHRVAYLPEIPSTALNERLESLLWMKERGQDPRLLIVVCRNDADAFSANRDVDPYFANLLSIVKEADIPIEVLRCSVDTNGMRAEHVIPFR